MFEGGYFLFTLDFRGGFERLVEEYNLVVSKKIDECKQLKRRIENRDSSLDFRKEVFSHIINQIILQGRSADVTDKIMGKMEAAKPFKNGRIEWLPKYFLDEEAEGVKILRQGRKKFVSNRKKEKIIEISKQLRHQSVADWIVNLHEGRIRGRSSMGPKSDDDFLKEHGFFDRVPIDVHSKRFLFRTGILHYYSKTELPNPSKMFSTNYNEQYKIFQNALLTFCHNFLSGIDIRGFDLAKNPGVVDLIIWKHCAESVKYGCRNICGDQPKCGECCFSDSCLQYVLKT